MNIQTLIRRFNQLTLNRQRIVVLVAAAVVIGIAIIGLNKGGPAPSTIAVTRGSLSQTVSVTGRLKAVQEVSLSFQNSGRVSWVAAKVGDRVVAGKLLASLDIADLNAQLREAQANVLAQQAKLTNIESGGRAEQIAIKESELRQAQQTLENAYANVYDVLSDAYTKMDNAMRIQLLAMFNSYGSEITPLFSLTYSCQCDVQSRTATLSRADAEVGLNRWKQELAGLIGNDSSDVFLSAIHNARGYLQSAKDTIAAVGSTLDDVSISLTTTQVQAYRTSTSTARASIVAAATEVNTQDQVISSAKLTVERITNELALTKAGSTPSEIDAQRAALMSAQAQVDGINAQIAKSIIRSPIKGIVTKQDAKVGQTAGANQTLIGVISDQQLEIEANIPEVDIGKVMTGDVVRVTVDALPGDLLMAKVSFIDPAETIIDGVVNFKVVMLLDAPNDQLKSGLTVNLEIETIKKDDILTLPQFAIIENNDGTFVRKPDGTQVPVGIGIRSQDGIVEITSGLAEGDLVLNIGLKSAK